MKPGTHLKIVKVGTFQEPYGDGSMFDQYYIVRSDDNTYGYVKLADVGSPKLDHDMPASEAPSLYGIAWEDPKITAARMKTAEAAARAECARRGTVRLGMSEAQVLASCFGSPTEKITTITAHLVRDKWVYGDEGAFLYFDNGKLVRIRPRTEIGHPAVFSLGTITFRARRAMMTSIRFDACGEFTIAPRVGYRA